MYKKKRAQIEQKSKQEASEPVSNMKETQAREKQERPELTQKVDSCEAKNKKATGERLHSWLSKGVAPSRLRLRCVHVLCSIRVFAHVRAEKNAMQGAFSRLVQSEYKHATNKSI